MVTFVKKAYWKIRNKKKGKEIEEQYQKILDMRKQFIEELEKRTFNAQWLDEMTFGNAEGERDRNLENTFLVTKSIKSISTGDYNYILAPKGCGKSSVFKAYEDRFKSLKEIQNMDQNIVVPINEAFSYENVLDNKSLLNKSDEKRWAVFWGVYLLKRILIEIKTERYEDYFNEFLKENRKYDELKADFQLYNIWDYMQSLKIALAFNLQGQEISVSPSIKKESITKKISLNAIFNDLQSTLESLNMRIFVLIDRIDDFVVGESKEKQRRFVQGLYNCVEEVCRCNNIFPILFLRTDLYYNLKIGTGSDKIQIRTLNLEWRKRELIEFIYLRLINSHRELEWCTGLPLVYAYDVCRQFVIQSESDGMNSIVAKDLGITSKTAQMVIETIFPQSCLHINAEGEEESIEFIEWIYTHFEDFTGYVNLRYLIVFFNKLFKEQYSAYERNANENCEFKLEYDQERERYYFAIFSNECIMKCYKEVQKIAIKNIKSLLADDIEKKCFEEIHFKGRTKRGNFYCGDVNFNKFDLGKSEYESLLDELEVLGYLRAAGKKYTIPILYQCDIETWR